MPTNPEENKKLEIVPFETTLVRLINEWREALVDRTSQFHDAMLRRKLNPNMTVDTNAGAKTITKIAEIRLSLVIEARERLNALEQMYAANKKGDDELKKMWDNDTLVIAPDARLEGAEETITPFGSKK